MTVPAWAAIPDSMVAPEAPVSSDLMTRLRNQAASVLGYDPASGSAPSFGLPTSTEDVSGIPVMSASGTGYSTITTGEIEISTVSASVEWAEPRLVNFNFEIMDSLTGFIPGAQYANAANWYSICDLSGSSAGPFMTTWGSLLAIDVTYVAGAPTGVNLTVGYNAGNGPNSIATVTITLANTWQTVCNHTVNGRTNTIQAKCRATSTTVYLQMRVTVSSDVMFGICVPVVVRSFKSKA